MTRLSYERLSLVVLLAVIAGGLLFYLQGNPPAEITSFDECAAAGNPIQESYPAVCIGQDGQRFVQEVNNMDALKGSE